MVWAAAGTLTELKHAFGDPSPGATESEDSPQDPLSASVCAGAGRSDAPLRVGLQDDREPARPSPLPPAQVERLQWRAGARVESRPHAWTKPKFGDEGGEVTASKVPLLSCLASELRAPHHLVAIRSAAAREPQTC